MFEGKNRNEANEQARSSSVDFVDSSILYELDIALQQRSVPVRDELTIGYNFDPTVDGARCYVEGAVKNKFAGRKAEGQEQIKELLGARKRAKWHIVDGVESTMWLGSAIARQRSQAVGSALGSISIGQVPDDVTKAYTADAVEDFGLSLMGDTAEPSIDVGYDGNLGADIAHIGRQMAEQPELCIGQAALLTVVAGEQQRRIDFFQPRLDATIDAYGNRLSAADRAVENDLQQLLSLAAVQQAA